MDAKESDSNSLSWYVVEELVDPWPSIQTTEDENDLSFINLENSNSQKNEEEMMDPLSLFAREREVIENRTVVEDENVKRERVDEATPKLFVGQESVLVKGETINENRFTNRPNCERSVSCEMTTNEMLKSKHTSKQRIFKIIVLGDTNVGKTCLTLRFCAGTFTGKSEATIGVDFREKNVEIGEDVVKLQIWDTAGLERFRKSMVPHYYRNANAIVFVYDITQQSSFESLAEWIKECDEFNLGKDIPRILIGNKCDLNDQIAITTNRAQRFADMHEMPLFETSAKDNSESNHIEAIFMTLAYKLKCCRPWMKLPKAFANTDASQMQLVTGSSRRKKRERILCSC